MATNEKKLSQDADQILQGIRIVLPGTQALMGFQFIAFFNPAFISLSQELKVLHFTALVLTVLCSLCLIAPVAFQQIGERGDTTRKFLSFTRVMLSASMLLLLVAITGDIYIASRTIGIENITSIIFVSILFFVGLSLWFLYSLLRRNSRAH